MAAWVTNNQFEMTLPKVLLEVSNSLHALEAVEAWHWMLLVRSLAVSWIAQEKKALCWQTNPRACRICPLSDYQTQSQRQGGNFFCDWLYHQMEDGELE